MAEKDSLAQLIKEVKGPAHAVAFLVFLFFCSFFLTQCSCHQEKVSEKRKAAESDGFSKTETGVAGGRFVVSSVPFSALKGWQNDDFVQALPALRASCLKASSVWDEFCSGLERFSYRPVTEGERGSFASSFSDSVLSDGEKGSAFGSENTDPVRSGSADMKRKQSEEVREYLESSLVPYRVSYEGGSEGVFTGYYEASLNGSFKKTEKYSVPVRGTPPDMVKVDWAAFGKSGMPALVGRVENGKLVPYYTRRQIEESETSAPVLLWVDDAADKFILQIQGSGRVKMPDGSFVRIGYADSNGLPFVSISSLMRQEGVLEKGKGSMPDIRAWLRRHPKKAKEIMNGNHRYIFFKFIDKNDDPLLPDGPVGAQGVPLTAGRSMAVDTRFVPLGTLLWLQTKDAYRQPLRRLTVAQDIGSAIKGGIRGDFFWGFGEEAFQEAGRMNSPGTYFLLLPKGAELVLQEGRNAFLIQKEPSDADGGEKEGISSEEAAGMAKNMKREIESAGKESKKTLKKTGRAQKQTKGHS